MKLRNWFFTITKTGSKRGTRFKTGDRPTEQTFKELTDSALFKSEANDKAKEDDGSNVTDLVGHVVLSTNAQAKANQDTKSDRSIAIQPHQLPEVKNESVNTSNSYGSYEGETVDVVLESETDASSKRNIYVLKIKEGYTNFINGIFNTISQAISGINTTLNSLSNSINTLNSKVQSIETSLEDVSSGNLDISEITPIGSLLPYAGAGAPSSKWLIADGGEYDRTTYASLFTTLGGANSPYGLPSGTTFNVPDMRSKTLKGKSDTYALGSTGGSDTVTLSATNLPYHKHSLTGNNASAAIAEAGAHSHDLWTWRQDKEEDNYSNGGFSLADDAHGKNSVKGSEWPNPQVSGEAENHTHSISGTTGDNNGAYTQTSFNVTGSYISLNYIIKAL